MALGNIEDQKLNEFAGLGYTPEETASLQQASAFGQARRAARTALEQSEWERKYRLQKQIDSEYAMEAPTKPQTLNEMVATRKSLQDAGLDTTAIDKQIGGQGVDTKIRKLADIEQETLDLSNEVLGRNTSPLTGGLQLGNTKDGWFGFNPGKKINQFLRPELTTTKAKVDQLKAKLQLANIKYIKGQGTVTDAERQILREAMTALTYDMSDTDFKKELTKVKDALDGTYAARKNAEGAKKGTDTQGLMDKYWGKK